MKRTSPEAARPVSAGRDLFRSEELRLIAALFLAALGLAGVLLGLAGPRTGALLLDFETWRLIGSSGADAGTLEGRLRPGIPAQRSFRLDLRLEEPAGQGELVAAERVYRVAPDGVYCFRVFVWSDLAGDEAVATPTRPRATVFVNGEPAVTWVPGRRGLGKLLRVNGIRPRGGEIELRLELRAGRGRAWREGVSAAPVHFEFAGLAPCGPGAPG